MLWVPFVWTSPQSSSAEMGLHWSDLSTLEDRKHKIKMYEPIKHTKDNARKAAGSLINLLTLVSKYTLILLHDKITSNIK